LMHVGFEVVILSFHIFVVIYDGHGSFSSFTASIPLHCLSLTLQPSSLLNLSL
jgi:hypothetical protein